MELSKPKKFDLTEKIHQDLISIFSKAIKSNDDKYQGKLNRLYDVVHSEEFLCIYKKLIEHVLDKIGIAKTSILVQKIPTIRIQEPNEKSVPFHIDKWSGHPKKILNIWIPLSQIYNTSALHLIPKDKSEELIAQVEEGTLSLKDLDAKASKYAEPKIIELGSFLVFNNDFLHGTVISKEEETRYSLDFRVALTPKELGNKKINIDYTVFPHSNEHNKPTREAHSVIYAANKYRNLGHKSQRTAINDYASINFISIISEASEFIGCVNTPQIDQYLEDSKERLILCFSKNSFSNEQLNSMKKHTIENQKRIIFALENKDLTELD